MTNECQNFHTNTGAWAALFGLSVVTVLCCGLPLMIGALGFTAEGDFLAVNRYWIFGGIAILMGIAMFVAAQKSRKSGADACCMLPRTKSSPRKENR